MSMNTPSGQIDNITPIKSFKTLETLNSDQYLLGIEDIQEGNGSKITLQNLKASLNIVAGDVSLDDFGCVADANYYNSNDHLWYQDSQYTTLATDNYTGIMAAISAADTNSQLLTIKGKYYSSQNVILPKKGLIGNGGIVGCDCIISCVQPYYTSGILYFDKLLICGSYLSEYDKLFVYGDIILRGNGYNGENYGFFWNKFRSIECQGKILFDMDGGHSINQNLFENVRARGGVHIKGSSTIVGKTSCNSNMFVNLDTSGADITAEDGTTGYQVLNESWANQCNIIQNWYAENGRCGIRGKWNILGIVQQLQSGRNGGLTIDRTSHSLFTIPSDTRMTCDFFAGTPVNKLLGGSWKYLGHKGQPLGLNFRNVDFEVIGVDGSPDGNPLALKVQVKNAGFSGLTIKVPVATQDTISICMYCKILNAPDFYTTCNTNTGSLYTTDNLIPVGNDWYLMRLTGISRTSETTYNLFTGELYGDGKQANDSYSSWSNYYTNFSINLNRSYDSSASEKPTMIIGSIFVSTEKTSFLPQFEQGAKEARSNAIPTGGIWKYGDRCYNSVPTVGQPMGWVCTTSGDYRILTGVTGSITNGTKELTVNDATNLYIGANINIAGVTGNKIVMNKVDNIITLDSNANATVTDGAISYVTPVWASMGNLT